MGRAEEEDIQPIQGHLGGKTQGGISPEALMHGSHRLPAMAFRMDKYQFHRRMVDQQPDQFSCGVTGTADDACPYHNYSPG
jgi:hypothetical protein